MALMESYLAHGIIGGGDANWYVNSVGDYLAQVRAGIFPVWVGQTSLFFFGGVFPLRFAPWLEHLSALIDLVTGRSLPFFVVLNLALTASLVGGLLSCYFCLLRIVTGRPWTAVALSFLYASCPGVLGIVYAQDLYMTYSALPFLPLVFLGIARSFASDDLESRLLMAGGLAGAWLAHPPIALSCGAVVFVTQIARIWSRGLSKRSILLDAATIVLFLILGGYSFVSAAYIPRPQANQELGDLLSVVRGAFPDNWLPLPRQIPLNNLQLGYALAVLFCYLLVGSFIRRDQLAISYAACATAILVAIVPVPYLNPLLWHLVPQAVLNVMNIWPMQRLLTVLALCIVFGAASLLRGIGRVPSIVTLLGLLFPIGVWSGFQAERLIAATNLHAPSFADSAKMQRPENLTVTNMFIAVGKKSGAPRYASGGVMDPELESRFLDRASKELRGSNVDAIALGFGPGPRRPGLTPNLGGLFTGKLDANPGILDLAPKVTLAPGKRYLLIFSFFEHKYSGILLIEGKDFFRIYSLPASGEPRSFGSGPESSRVIPLWTTSGGPEELQLRFVPTSGEKIGDYMPFARFELRAYDPRQLPIQLESLTPYRVRVKTGTSVFLETPRLAIPTYAAMVDGTPAPVQTSPDGFVIVPIDPGVHDVIVDYRAPIGVQLAYWAGVIGWLSYVGLLGWLVCGPRSREQQANLSLV
jgi:hypothetical protein